MGNKKATGFLCLRLVPCFAYVGAEDNRKGIPFVKIVSLLCKLIQFLMVALSVTVHKALHFQGFSAFYSFAAVDGLPASRLASASASSAGAVPKALCVRRFALYRFACGDPVLIYNI